MEITKDYKGLIDDGCRYRIDGNITTENCLSVSLDKGLFVIGLINAGGLIEAGGAIEAGGSIEAGWLIEAGGAIRAGGSIEAGEWIKAGGSIEVGEWINAGGLIEAGEWIKAGGAIEAGGSIEAGEWINAGGAIRYKDIVVDGMPTEKFISISMFYKVSIYDTHIRIGCELHSREQWYAFTDKEILEMDGKQALKFWKENKDLILGL